MCVVPPTAIQLAKMPDFTVIAQAIRSLDSKVLSAEQVEALCKIMPTAEEIRAVNESSVSDHRLERPELFIRTISAVPQVR